MPIQARLSPRKSSDSKPLRELWVARTWLTKLYVALRADVKRPSEGRYQSKSDGPYNVFMQLVPWVELMLCWFAWIYPFLFRAPHFQKRPSVTRSGPSAVGLVLEGMGIFAAFVFRLPPDNPPGTVRLALSLIFAVAAAILSWSSVRHLGRQFRIQAGLYEDHQLIRTGPYGFVRHPIYASPTLHPALHAPLVDALARVPGIAGVLSAGDRNPHSHGRAVAGIPLPG
jgi:Isoprenylcysteine carboxyl methyltransferase (ICMT) family